uniref:USP domain-containing protein n=1 Tax=viral metagenome TaxID=1070528 RepID=A0A6C0IL58_9ZZZZ
MSCISYENKGLSGMANLGNSCYLNSCMQIISHTYELNKFLSEDNGKYKNLLKKIPESIVLLEWDKLREMLWSSNCTVAPHGFVKTIRQVARIKKLDIFTGYQQNDIQEFLLFIIDCFHTALSREVDMHISGDSKNETDALAVSAYKMMQNMYKKDYSDMLSIFYGIHISQITTMETNEVMSMASEPFSIISLSISPKNNPTLFDCFDLYCNSELLEGENAWFNGKTGQKETAKRNIIFWSLPNIMIIDLKRSKVDHKKIHTLIDIPLDNVDFSKYVKGYNAHTYIYDLYGVCNHSGGGGAGGHYFAYIKNANGKWYSFNDTMVNEIPLDKVISSMSYCLFYRKQK